MPWLWSWSTQVQAGEEVGLEVMMFGDYDVWVVWSGGKRKLTWFVAVSDDDVGVIPVFATPFTHIPQPPTMRTVGPRLRDVSNAKLVLGRDDLQRGGLLPRSKRGLPDCQVREGTGIDQMVGFPRSSAMVFVLVESLDQRSRAGRMLQCTWYTLVAVQSDCDADG